MFGKHRNQTTEQPRITYHVWVPLPGCEYKEYEYAVTLPMDLYSSEYLQRVAFNKGTPTGMARG